MCYLQDQGKRQYLVYRLLFLNEPKGIIMNVIKVESKEPKYGNLNRKFVYINDKPVGFVFNEDAIKIDQRIRRMVKKYKEKYHAQYEMAHKSAP